MARAARPSARISGCCGSRGIASRSEHVHFDPQAAGDAIRINGLSFGIGDTAKAQGRARELAVGDARTQAEQLAKAAGVKLGALRTIRTSAEPVVGPQQFNTEAAVAKASVPIEAGSLEVSASVQLVYDIA